MAFYLLSHLGTLLTFGNEAGRFDHVALDAVGDSTRLVGIDLPVENFRMRFEDLVSGRSFVLGANVVRLADGAMTLFNRDAETVGLMSGDGFVSVTDDRLVVAQAQTAGPWESFLPVTVEDLVTLRDLLSLDWIVAETRTLVRAADIALSRDFMLSFGGIAVRIHDIVWPVTRLPVAITFLRDGWNALTLVRFQPAVFYTVSGSEDVLAQLEISIASLRGPGCHRGVVHLFTDQTDDDVRRRLQPRVDVALGVTTMPAHDFTGWVARKYAVLDAPSLRHCQPLLYVDADVVFDDDITAALVAIALSDRICAPEEPYSPLASSRGVGADFFARAGRTGLEGRHGFNAGTVGIPNIPDHAATLSKIRMMITRTNMREGRGSLEWVDQELLNYAAHVDDLVDLAVLSPHVRFPEHDDAEIPAHRTGIVHFWKVRTERVATMRLYLGRVLQAIAGA